MKNIQSLKMRLGRWKSMKVNLEDLIKAKCADDTVILTEADWKRWKKKRTNLNRMIGRLQAQLTRSLKAKERMEKYNAEAKQRAREYQKNETTNKNQLLG